MGGVHCLGLSPWEPSLIHAAPKFWVPWSFCRPLQCFFFKFLQFAFNSIAAFIIPPIPLGGNILMEPDIIWSS